MLSLQSNRKGVRNKQHQKSFGNGQPSFAAGFPEDLSASMSFAAVSILSITKSKPKWKSVCNLCSILFMSTPLKREP